MNTDEETLNRARGCLAGQLCGDALGSQVEFSGPEAIKLKFPDGIKSIDGSPVFRTIAGQPTDDSELALALARSVVAEGMYLPNAAAEAYLAWRASGPFDCGGTIGNSLYALRVAKEAGRNLLYTAVGRSTISEANGALMRQSPLAIAMHNWKWFRRVTMTEYDTMLTHPNPVCMDCSTIYVETIAATIKDHLDAEGAYSYALDLAVDYCDPASKTLRAVSEAQAKPAAVNGAIGHCVVALHNAFYQLLNTSSPAEAISASAEAGGDTDTNAAIAGALAGAAYGERAFPQAWLDTVVACKPGPGTSRPRPETYWPYDYRVVAESLAEIGASSILGGSKNLRNAV